MRHSASLGVLLAMVLPALAHVEMIYPPPINSKWDPQTLEVDKDYSMTSPLFPDGSNYPCKGYNVAENYAKLNSVATLVAGQPIDVKLSGTATHNGGSCQWAISYDQGKTFAVIASVIGGCPLGLDFTIPLPDDLPSGKKATLSWTWFNYSGNREAYQNCAIVDVVGPSGSTSYTGPTLFRANTFQDGTCVTVENTEVVFPAPGPSVQYAGASNPLSNQTTLEPCFYNQDGLVTVYGDDYVPPSSSSDTTTPPASTVTISRASRPTIDFTTSTTLPVPVATRPASTPSTIAATLPPSSSGVTTSSVPTSRPPRTRPGVIVTRPSVRPGFPRTKTGSTTAAARTTTIAMPSASTPAAPASFNVRPSTTLAPLPSSRSMASKSQTVPTTQSPASTSTTPSPAASTPSSARSSSASSSATSTTSSTALPSAPSSNDNTVRCDSETTWSLCSNGQCYSMGQVAPGTRCLNGAIVMARKRTKRGLLESAPASHQRMVVVRRRSPRLASER